MKLTAERHALFTFSRQVVVSAVLGLSFITPHTTDAATVKRLTEKQFSNLDKTIRYAASTIRRKGIDAVGRLHKDDQARFKPLLIDLIKNDSDAMVRATTAHTLGELKVDGSVLVAALKKETNDDATAQMVYALKKLDYRPAGPVFLQRLKEIDLTQNNNMAISLIDALTQMKEPSGKSLALEQSKNPKCNRDLRFRFMLYLGAIKSSEARSFLNSTALDREEKPNMRGYAVNALGKIGNRADLAGLQSELEYINGLDPDTKKPLASLRSHLIQACIRLGARSKLLPLIFASAKDDDARMRVASIKFLGQIKEKTAVPLLEYSSKYDASPKVKRAAKKALKEITGKDPAAKK